jgi:hypothetical protein
LAIHYDPPLGPFSEYFFLCTFCCTRVFLSLYLLIYKNSFMLIQLY